MDSGLPHTIPTRTDSAQRSGASLRIIPRASAAIASGRDWTDTLDTLLGHIDIEQPDLAFISVSPHYTEYLPDLLQTAWDRSGATLLAGGSTTGPIAERIEAEDQPAMSMLALSLPGALLRPARFTPALLEDSCSPGALSDRLSLDPDDVNGWIVLAAHHPTGPERLISCAGVAYPGKPIVGGVASPAPHSSRSWVFLNGAVYSDGGVGIAIGGNYDITPVVAQGCEPIGETWTITGVRDDQWIDSISNRSALALLAETLDVLPTDMQEEAEGHLVAGFAANEYQHHFDRGDFLLRDIIAVDWERGALAVAATPRVGQTIQFHLRDAATASLDLTLSLMEAQNLMGGRTPVAALIHSCPGRGAGFFGTPDHEAAEFDRRFPGLPHAGMVTTGQFWSTGSRGYVQRYSASIGIITRRNPATGPE